MDIVYVSKFYLLHSERKDSLFYIIIYVEEYRDAQPLDGGWNTEKHSRWMVGIACRLPALLILDFVRYNVAGIGCRLE